VINYRYVSFLVVLLTLTLPIACKKKTPITDSHLKPDPCTTGDEYFPPASATWSGRGLHFGADQVEWESEFLRRMQEPSLYKCADIANEPEYRFLWDRSLSEPIAARLVVHKNGSGTLFVHMLANSGLPPPPEHGEKPSTPDNWYQMKIDQQIKISPEEVATALGYFHQISFWNARPRGETTDGSDWIFESKVQGQYRLVDFRNVPSPAAKAFGLYLVLTIAKLSIDRRTIY